MEEDLKVHATEHSDGGEQIEITPQTYGAALTSRIQLFIAVPTSFLLSVSSEEHLDIHQLSLLPCLIAGWVLWDREGHANAYSVAGCEGGCEVNASPGIIDIFSTVVAMYTKTSALPARKAESGIRRRDEADCNACVCLLERATTATDASHSEFEINCLRLLGAQRCIYDSGIHWQVGQDARVAAVGMGANLPMPSLWLWHDVSNEARCSQQSELRVLNGYMS